MKSFSLASTSTCSTSCSTSVQGARIRSRVAPAPSTRLAPLRASIPNEADSLYKGIPLSTGLINRRLMEKQMSKENKEFTSAMKLADDDVRREQLFRRETRTAAASEAELIEYFLNTVAEDMDFEVSRCRPALNETFFRYLDKVIGEERFSGQPDEDKLVELEALRQYLTSACEVVDQTVAKTSSAKERMTKLLSSKDKKATILEMAEANEIDQPLMDLLQQNIQMARMAGQEDPAKFMEKVMQACAKFLIVAPAPALPPLPALGAPAAATGLPAQLQQLQAGAPAPAAAPPSLILPGSAPRRPRASNMGVPMLPKPDGASSLIIPGR